MRRDEDYFGECPLVLIYIAKRLADSLAVEKILDGASVDYLVEVDYYVGGMIFRNERAGAFFYVEEAQQQYARDLIRSSGYKPQEAD